MSKQSSHSVTIRDVAVSIRAIQKMTVSEVGSVSDAVQAMLRGAEEIQVRWCQVWRVRWVGGSCHPVLFHAFL
jgi:hypothetical protein